MVRGQVLRARSAIVSAIRGWFEQHGYHEVHTPVLVPAPAMEEHLEPVQVGDRFLHTSPEFAMKRILATGLCRIYQIVPCFREEEIGRHHAREFTMLEWYRVGAGTPELMDEVEEIVGVAAQAVGVPNPVFRRDTVEEWMHTTGFTPTDDEDAEDAWFRHWIDHVEPRFTTPTIVHGYPSWQAALSRIRDDRADRFEVYLGGIELANAFAEEIDPRELVSRFERSAVVRRTAGKMPHPVDEALIDAVATMPRCAGIALGVDRLVMALLQLDDIAEVVVR